MTKLTFLKTVVIAGTLAVTINTTNAQDGTLDSTFNANSVFSGSGHVYNCKIQNDGKYVAIGGLVIVVSGSNFIYGVTRLNSDGTMDTGFTSGIPTPTTLRAIDIQSDGKIIVAGHSSNIWRLNTNGTICLVLKKVYTFSV